MLDQMIHFHPNFFTELFGVGAKNNQCTVLKLFNHNIEWRIFGIQISPSGINSHP
jgi:hypothetical protein